MISVCDYNLRNGRPDVLMDVHTDTYADVHTESSNALDALNSKISPVRFRYTKREVCSSNSSVMAGTVKLF